MVSATATSPSKTNCKVSESSLELIRLLCLPDKIIGQYLKISPAAVAMRITRISIKLGVENRTSVVVKALELGLVNIDQLVRRDYGVQNCGKTNSS